MIRHLTVGRLLRFDTVATVLQAVGVVAGLVTEAARPPAAVAFVVLFLAGSVLFLLAFLVAAGRSRDEQLDVAGAFFLGADAAPPDTRRPVFLLLAAQTVIGLAGGFAAPFTGVAFGLLVPMVGIGVMGALGSLHGTFAPIATTVDPSATD